MPDEPIPDKDIPGAVRSEKGALVGNAVKSVIGVQGGALKFPNSEVKLTIPAGAVESDVEFSIQEVEYKLPFGAIGKAYRFLPENVIFKKDVEITIPFDELTNTSTKALSLAYQDNKGYWHMVRQPVVNEYENTVTAKTRHFSDWGVASRLRIENTGKRELSKGETTTLQIKFTPIGDGPNIDDLLLNEVQLDDSHVKEWRASRNKSKQQKNEEIKKLAI